jgi:uncharacterized protein
MDAKTTEAGHEFSAFVPRAPWLSGDLQTLRNWLRPQASLPGERLLLPLGDGDALAVALNEPVNQARAPLIVLIHGLSGCEESAYIVASARHFLSLGYRVLRLNLRGAGPSRGSCGGHYHAGRSEDLRAALAVLRDMGEGAFVLYAYSLGANMVLKALGEGGGLEGVLAAIAVSAPIDLAAASTQFAKRRNAPYQRWLLGHMRREALGRGARLSEAERRAIASAKSVRAFDDGFVAPRHGFADADDYYASSSALPYLARIATPTLVIHAEDDPWIPAAAYRRQDWSNPALSLLMPLSGGHVGFHGAGSAIPWHDRCAEVFLKR